jgi:hypothetical protein
VGLFFTLVSAACTWPLVTHLGDTLPDWADPADSSWRIGSLAGQLLADPLHLYQTTAFYPIHNGLALDELLTGQGLLAAPLIWLTGNPPLAFNVLVFLSYVLSGVAMWWLVRDLTGSDAVGVVAGLIFAFAPWHYEQFGHLGLSAQQWMVVALVFLRRFLRGSLAAPRLLTAGTLLNLGGFLLFAVLQALVAGYYAYFEAILFAFYGVYYLLGPGGIGRWLGGRRRGVVAPTWGRLGGQAALLAGAALIGLAALLPFVWPFMQAQRTFGFARSVQEASYWSAAPTSLLRTSPRSLLYAPVQVGVFGLETSSERAMYPGVVATALALLGVVGGLRRRKAAEDGSSAAPAWRGERWVFVAVMLAGLILSFGPTLNLDAYGNQPTGLPLPYGWLYQWVPGFDALRVPARFGQLFMLGLAVCAGYGILDFRFWLFERIQGSSKSQKPKAEIVFALLLALIVADYWAPGLPATPTPTGAAAPALYRWLAGPEAARLIPRNALLLELPIGTAERPVNTNPIVLMYGLAHGRPMLNGSANIIPPGYDRLFYQMRRFPTPATLDLAEGLGVQYLIVHTGGLLNDERRAALAQEAAPGGRLEALVRFPDPLGDANSAAVVYRLKPAPERWAALGAWLPAGAEVLLADHPGHRQLLTTVLPRLIGPDRRYFLAYSTVYAPLMPSTRLATPGQTYPYAIFYGDPDSAAEPAKYGYTPAERLPAGDAVGLAVYQKQP